MISVFGVLCHHIIFFAIKEEPMNMRKSTANWIRVGFLNLLLVALLGVVMRYKITFYLPFVDQKHILHAHSHFAFAGWITLALMILLVYCLSLQKIDLNFKKYRWLLLANFITAYGMLLSFPIQGYGAVSITFSTLSIIVSYVFAVIYWRDLNSVPYSISHSWFKGALLFSVISSAGTYALSTMMMTKSINQHMYLASIYFYLHFQYNGWFFFACMGLFANLIKDALPIRNQKIVFWLFALSCIPAYILSALWLPIPDWVHSLVSIAAVTQVAAWAILLAALWKNKPIVKITLGKVNWVFALVLIAVSVKLFLQLGSTVHFLSDLAFSFRPIVIGYLHLVLLGVITLFIIGYVLVQGLAPQNKRISTGLIVFIAGIILNEFLLMLQGVNAMAYIRIPFINELLLFAALVMFSGVLLVNIGDWKQQDYYTSK
ncbi:MAG: hypothetical protein V4615_11800 [Bacteroidota bacterium]